MEYPSLNDTFFIVSDGLEFGEYKLIAVTSRAYGVEKDDGIKWITKKKVQFVDSKKLDDFNSYFICRIPKWIAKNL